MWILWTWELRLARRSPRILVTAFLYLAVLTVLPGLYMWHGLRLVFEANLLGHTVGPASVLQILLLGQPPMTLLLAALWVGGNATTTKAKTLWPVLTSSPWSNLRFILSRWFAVTALVSALAVLPLAATAAQALYHGIGPLDPTAWLGAWALRVLVAAAAGTAFWLGLVTILGSELLALSTVVAVKGVVSGLLNEILFPLRVRLDFRYLDQLAADLQEAFKPAGVATAEPYRFHQTVAPELAPDLVREVQLLPWPSLAVSCLLLGLAPLFLRRTLRDLRPLRDTGGPLRTFVKISGRFRQFFAPAAAPGRDSLVLVAAASLLFLGAAANNIGQQKNFEGMAADQVAVELGDPLPPMTVTLEPASWKVTGTVQEDGWVDLQVQATFENRGEEPEDRLAFQLSPDLELIALANGRQTDVQRRGDRLALRLPVALLPGQSVDLDLQLRGRPMRTRYAFPEGSSLASRMERHTSASFVHDVANLAASTRRPAAMARDVRLDGADLTPLPRYSPWTLNDEGRIPPDLVWRPVLLEVDLRVPPAWSLTDSCGGLNAGDRFQSRCRLPLREGAYSLRGGAPRAVWNGGQLVTITLPAHQGIAEHYRDEMARTVELANTAWPGIEGLPDGLVLFEISENLDGGYNLLEKVLTVEEYNMTLGRLPRAPRIAAEAIHRELLHQRRVDDDETHLFFATMRHLARLSVGMAKTDASIAGSATTRPRYRQSIFDVTMDANSILYTWDGMGVLYTRLPGILNEVRHRLGAATFQSVVDDFLNAPGVGTYEEFLERFLAAPGGAALKSYFDEYIYGGALPELVLTDVRATRRGAKSWEVRGTVRNDGTGHATCPVVVKTEESYKEQSLTVGPEAAVTFRFVVEGQPLTAELDPAQTCFRHVTARDYRTYELVDLRDIR